MPVITLNLRIEEYTRALKRLRATGAQAIVRALNRAAVTTRTVMQRAVAEDMGIKVDTSRDAIKVKDATVETLRAQVIARGARIPLIEFHATGPSPSRGRGPGVAARLPGGRNRYPDAFIAKMASGHRGVFQRLTPKSVAGQQLAAEFKALKRKTALEKFQSAVAAGGNLSARKSRGAWSKNLPIYELHGPSIALVFDRHRDEGLTAGEASLTKNLEHEFQWAIRQAAGGS